MTCTNTTIMIRFTKRRPRKMSSWHPFTAQPSVRLAGRLRLGWPAHSRKHCLSVQCFSDRTVFFSHNNQPEQYFDLFFSPAEQAPSLLARYQECMAKLPNDMMLASDDSPWIIPNFLFIAARVGLDLATCWFFDHPTSSPMLRSRSILCLFFIICKQWSTMSKEIAWKKM